MTRVIFMSGKGGVGKTTVASATGLACAKRGLRTLILSIDIAHSLSDSFALPGHLLNTSEGKPVTVCDNLDIQEIDLHKEIERHWGDLYGAIERTLKKSGMNDVLAEELAIIPGMDDVVCLLYINKYIEENSYDVIVLDSAPTGESLRFISMPSSIEWYMQKFRKMTLNVSSIAKPLNWIMGGVAGSVSGDYASLRKLYKRLGSIRDVLLDNKMTTVRLVLNAERMVVNETLRAYMYFCLYGMTVDMVTVNRVLPEEANNGYFDQWMKEQNEYLEQIDNHFAPSKVIRMRMFPREVRGLERLEAYGKELFRDCDPEAVHSDEKPYEITDTGDVYLMKIKLPGADKDHVDLFKENEELIVRIGNFKRHIYLPTSLSKMKPEFARCQDGCLTIQFKKEKEQIAVPTPS